MEKDVKPGSVSVAADGAVYAGAKRTPRTPTIIDWAMFKRFSSSGEIRRSVSDAPAMLTGFCLREGSVYVGSYDGGTDIIANR
jgi:hypothetical protein